MNSGANVTWIWRTAAHKHWK